jgi:hypothetical protein
MILSSPLGPKTGKDLNARRSSKVIDVEATPVGGSSRGDKKGQKFRALKAREAVQKAASQAGNNNGNGASVAVQKEDTATAVAAEEAQRVPDAPPAKNNEN